MKTADEKWRKETQRDEGFPSSSFPSVSLPPASAFLGPSSPSTSPRSPSPSFLQDYEKEEEREGEETEEGVLELSMEKRKKEFKTPKIFTDIGEEFDKVWVVLLFHFI